MNGRGQYGRKWISYKGNIFLSFFYSLDKINLSMALFTKKNCFLVKIQFQNIVIKNYISKNQMIYL